MTTHMMGATRDTQNFKSAAKFRLHFNAVTITINITVNHSLIVYLGFVWADHHPNCKSHEDHVYFIKNGALLCLT